MAAQVARMACVVLAVALGNVQGARTRQKRVDKRPQLPFGPLALVGAQGNWWAQDGENTYFPPQTTDLAELSQNISDYYYAIGSTKSLSQEHLRHRVGGSSRVHIFYLPGGPAELEERVRRAVAKASGGEVVEGGEFCRGSIHSELRGLTQGSVLGSFPEWNPSPSYADPLDSAGLAKEREAMSRLTASSYRKEVEELTREGSANLKVSTRNAKNEAATSKVVAFIEAQFKSTGVATCIQTFEVGSWYRKFEVSNVIAYVPGTASGSVTLGAHFDDLPSSGSAPGAVDNGSGAAAVLAAAKAFMGAGLKPKKSVYFVAFGGEEYGLYGSARFARELKSPGSTSSPIPQACRTRASSDHKAFTMDMIGWRNPSFSQDTVLLETKSWSAALLDPLAKANAVNNGASLKLLYSDNPFGSDHMSFLDNNFQCTLSIDNDGNTDNYPCYHRSCDTISYVSDRLGSEIAKMNFGALLRVAGLN